MKSGKQLQIALEYRLNNIGPAHNLCETEKDKVLVVKYSDATHTFMNLGYRYN